MGVRRPHHRPAAPPTDPADPPPDAFWGDTSTIPPAQNVLMVKVLNRTNGQYPDSQVFWSFNGQTHSIAEQPYLDMPANSAGRMYFYLGTPNSQYFDFIEFTVGPDVFNGNTTRVDAFGLKLAHAAARARRLRRRRSARTRRPSPRDRAATFQQFIDEVPAEFKVLAQTQAPFRIPSPGSDPSFRAGGVNANYFTAYAASVGITAADVGHLRLRRRAGQRPGPLRGAEPARRPAAAVAVVRRRALYYQAAPANYYAKFWHDHAINHLAYGFPYDDVAGQSSFISHGNPQ